MDTLNQTRNNNYFKKISKNLQHYWAMDTLRRFIHRLGTFRPPKKKIVRSNNATRARPHRLQSNMNQKPTRDTNSTTENTTITTWLLKDAITNEDIRMTSLREEEPRMDKQTMLKFSKVCHL